MHRCSIALNNTYHLETFYILLILFLLTFYKIYIYNIIFIILYIYIYIYK